MTGSDRDRRQETAAAEESERQGTCPDTGEIDAIRNALRRYDAITNVFRPNGDVLPEPDLSKLERTVRFGRMAFQASNYLANQATTTLLDADQLAPEEVRCRDLTKQIITDLVRSYPRGLTPAVGVTKLARAVGIAV